MRILIVKMSSLGDVVHTLPAVTDALEHRVDLRIDWVVEEGFRAIPGLHPGIETVIPVAIRRWRSNWRGALGEIRAFRRRLSENRYDLVIDAQGLIKSAIVTKLCRGEKVGLDAGSAREPLAALAYDRKIAVPPGQHAVERTRQLFAAALDYPLPGDSPPHYGLSDLPLLENEAANIMLLHGTTWASKQWPVACWQALGRLIEADGYRVTLPFGDAREQARAEEIAAGLPSARILPRLELDKLAGILGSSAGAVTVDTGLGHLAAALDVPLVALYGPTDPRLTGIYGIRQTVLVGSHLPCIPCLKRVCKYRLPDDSSKIYPPCFATMTPAKVWASLKLHIQHSE